MPGVSPAATTASWTDQGAALGDHLAVQFTSWGRGEDLLPLEKVEPTLADCPSETPCAARLEYARDGVVEWWRAGGAFAEQGWTIPAPPPGEGDLVLENRVSGAAVADTVDGVALLLDDGGRTWNVGRILAWDADGTSLPTRLESGAGSLVIAVDDTDARYPITVDPLYSSAAWMTYGESTYAEYGYKATFIGDVNADGYDDVAVYANAWASNTGRVYVFHGKASGLPTTASLTLTGEATANYFGNLVSPAGDVNNDGYDDLLVGAYGYSGGTGRAYLYHGSASGLSSTAATTLTGVSTSIYFGQSGAGVGDVNGDGYDDVVIGAYGYSSSKGRAYGYLGSASGISTTAAQTWDGGGASYQYGTAVSAAGDMNNDGYADFLVSAPGYSSYTGRVYAYSGRSTGFPTGSDTNKPSGEGTSQFFGTSMAPLGDVNGDGYDDVAIASTAYSSNTGKVYFYYGSSSGIPASASTTKTGASTYCAYGSDLTGGDFDADGYSDVAIGANKCTSGWVPVYGSSSAGVSSSILQSFWGIYHGSSEYLGTAVSMEGDADGDGFNDLLVTGYGYYYYTGSAQLFRGYRDMDGDGVPSTTDCDDTDILVGSASTRYVDADGDGHGTTTSATVCPGVAGWASTSTDCDDEDASVNPGATDAVCDGVDQDCSGTDAGSFSIEACNVQWPYATTVEAGADTEWIYGRVYASGVTGAHGTPSTCLEAELCYGADGTDPASDPSWTCVAADYNTYYVNDDEYQATLTPSTAGTYDYAWRFSGDTGGTWTYCDTSWSGPTDPYTSSAAGSLTVVPPCADADLDGHPDSACGGTDCDDTRATVSPDGTETCNGLDDDCDGGTDEGVESTFYADSDGDGFGAADRTTLGCSAPTGYVADATDCDDARATVNPRGAETCNGLDDDCDGDTDEPSASDVATWYRDADGDGWGLSSSTKVACDTPSGYAALAGDCDDGDPRYHPDAAESDCTDPHDYDCDGTVIYTDEDGDDHAACVDCDDSDAAVNPDSPETCNGKDDDCDGAIDEAGATGEGEWYADADGDGVPSATDVATACEPPPGHVGASSSWDCDDGDATVNPGVTEVCNEKDDDCDGAVDEADALDATTWYLDADGDGYGLDTRTTAACFDAPTGHVAIGGDCDDGDAAFHPGAPETDCSDPNDYDCDGLVRWADADADGWAACLDCDDARSDAYPGATESCNGVDDDCDGSADEAGALGETLWVSDQDGDGYAVSTATVSSCAAPVGFVSASASRGEDCDDARSEVNPGATEVCNGGDDDCDGVADEDDAVGTVPWYADGDLDGYGDERTFVTACAAPEGHVAATGEGFDCDDTRPEIHPGAEETDCTDPTDYNCDGAVGFVDSDGDTHAACAECDDSDPDVFPGAAEGCDEVDNDCDTLVDDADPDVTGTTDWYADVDGDGHGDAFSFVNSCEAPEGHVAATDDGFDCDDTRADIHPGATEADCTDPTDYNCDGSVGFADEDGDGWAACEDCDDFLDTVNPTAAEVCNHLDDDCDGAVDGPTAEDATAWYADADADGYTDASASLVDCEPPAGYAALSAGIDCDDTDPSSHPGAEDVPEDGLDQDCDGTDARDPGETGEPGDTGEPVDTAGPPDTDGPDDTGSGDTGTGDTGAGDTGTGETGTGDTGTGDTDTGDTDTGDTETGDTDTGDTNPGETGTGDTDTGDTDTGDTDTGDPGQGGKTTCGCQASRGVGSGWLALLLVGLFVRRSRSAEKRST